MAKLATQGTTVTFGGVLQGRVVNTDFSSKGNEQDVTGLSDSSHTCVVTTPSIECPLSIIGAASSMTIGATGTMVIAYSDSTTDDGGGVTFVVVDRKRGAKVDGVHTVDVTLKPYGG